MNRGTLIALLMAVSAASAVAQSSVSERVSAKTADKTSAGILSNVVGSVELVHEGRIDRVNGGEKMLPGDVLSTGASAFAMLRFEDGSRAGAV